MKNGLNYISVLQIFKGTLLILVKEQKVLINKCVLSFFPFFPLGCGREVDLVDITPIQLLLKGIQHTVAFVASHEKYVLKKHGSFPSVTL